MSTPEMSTNRDYKHLISQVKETVTVLSTVFANFADQFIQGQHKPIEVSPGEFLCRNHWKNDPVQWPCREWTAAERRLKSRQ